MDSDEKSKKKTEDEGSAAVDPTKQPDQTAAKPPDPATQIAAVQPPESAASPAPPDQAPQPPAQTAPPEPAVAAQPPEQTAPATQPVPPEPAAPAVEPALAVQTDEEILAEVFEEAVSPASLVEPKNSKRSIGDVIIAIGKGLNDTGKISNKDIVISPAMLALIMALVGLFVGIMVYAFTSSTSSPKTALVTTVKSAKATAPATPITRAKVIITEPSEEESSPKLASRLKAAAKPPVTEKVTIPVDCNDFGNCTSKKCNDMRAKVGCPAVISVDCSLLRGKSNKERNEYGCSAAER